MKVQAKAKYIHMSPRKTRLVVDLIRGMSVADARAQLTYSPKAAAKPVLKALNSASANATNNAKMKEADLVVDQAFVDEGPTFHRFKPRAHGRATKIRKRMSHITIVVSDGKEEEKKPAKAAVKKASEKPQKEEKKAPAAKKPAKAKAAKKTTEKKSTKKTTAKS